MLSADERAKGFVRPVRCTYVHVGRKVHGTIRELTVQEKADYADSGYVAFEEYPLEMMPRTGRFLTQKEMNALRRGRIGGCGVATTMSRALAETYSRQPSFYASTWCMGCSDHLPVEEFVWDGTEETVGS